MIPESVAKCFASKAARSALASHEGYDPGALRIFNHLRDLAAFSLAGETSRLVIELNRSLHHRNLLCRFTRDLPKTVRQTLISEIHDPFRDQVRQAIQQSLPVIHLSVHTFTPRLHGVERNCDLALLYDPQRPHEKTFCDKIAAAFHSSPFRFRRNHPYRGIADGHTKALRKIFPDSHYSGIELEVSQHFFDPELPETESLLNLVRQSIIPHVRIHEQTSTT